MSPGFQITSFIIGLVAIILSCLAIASVIKLEQDVDKIYSDVYIEYTEPNNEIVALTPTKD